MKTGIFFRIMIFLITFAVGLAGCTEKVEEDPCLKTKWVSSKVLEIKPVVKVTSSNTLLPSGAPGSDYPEKFNEMLVTGTIMKVDCSDQISDLFNLGNTSIVRGLDIPAEIGTDDAYWIGYVVYVYELANDKDHLDINVTVKITMLDHQSYTCNVSESVYYPQIVLMPGEMYYYVLLDIYSDNWIKI
ncbi:MAG: hypothetical protein IPN67_05720 [Bacteroidales bacterium]|nr:hypothetical protein [Bacteroidales bacterium]